MFTKSWWRCQNTFKTENGLKIHIGKAHKKVNQVQATPEQLRQWPEGSMNISTSPLLDASREESCLNTDAVEEIEEPTPPRQPPPATPPPSKPSPSPPVILKKPVRMLNGDPVWMKMKWWADVLICFFTNLSRMYRAAKPKYIYMIWNCSLTLFSVRLRVLYECQEKNAKHWRNFGPQSYRTVWAFADECFVTLYLFVCCPSCPISGLTTWGFFPRTRFSPMKTGPSGGTGVTDSLLSQVQFFCRFASKNWSLVSLHLKHWGH